MSYLQLSAFIIRLSGISFLVFFYLEHGSFFLLLVRTSLNDFASLPTLGLAFVLSGLSLIIGFLFVIFPCKCAKVLIPGEVSDEKESPSIALRKLFVIALLMTGISFAAIGLLDLISSIVALSLRGVPYLWRDANMALASSLIICLVKIGFGLYLISGKKQILRFRW
ncbi:hypothetical protein [uncultured Cohaesibacter sp.]|uniref:hypothetical protein n=1 Tax=uncultured Cohaesibacter sp. TaxID=1002546 RepID=UPI002AAB26CE|nr:hypothetical protein [uncultured Cohaesibacter sp.]